MKECSVCGVLWRKLSLRGTPIATAKPGRGRALMVVARRISKVRQGKGSMTIDWTIASNSRRDASSPSGGPEPPIMKT